MAPWSIPIRGWSRFGEALVACGVNDFEIDGESTGQASAQFGYGLSALYRGYQVDRDRLSRSMNSLRPLLNETVAFLR